MTTELPSGDTSTLRKLTPLKNSSNVSFGFCATENSTQLKIRASSKAGFRIIGFPVGNRFIQRRSEEHTSELQSRPHLVCRLLLEKKNKQKRHRQQHPGDSRVA